MAEIDDVVKKMLTREGFIEVFWKTLSSLREVEPGTPRRAVFEMLNTRYADEVGLPMWPSYEAFKMYAIRKYKQKRTK